MASRLYMGVRVHVKSEYIKHFNADTNTTDMSLSPKLAEYHAYRPHLVNQYARAFVLIMTTPRHLFSTVAFKTVIVNLFDGKDAVHWNATCAAIMASFRTNIKRNVECPVGTTCVWSFWAAFIEAVIIQGEDNESFILNFTKRTDFTERAMYARPTNLCGTCPFNHSNDELGKLTHLFGSLRRAVLSVFLEYLQCCANGIDFIQACSKRELLEDLKIQQDDCKEQLNGYLRSLLMSFVVANGGAFNDRNLTIPEYHRHVTGLETGDMQLQTDLHSQTVRVGSMVLTYSEIYSFPSAFAKLFVDV